MLFEIGEPAIVVVEQSQHTTGTGSPSRDRRPLSETVFGRRSGAAHEALTDPSFHERGKSEGLECVY